MSGIDEDEDLIMPRRRTWLSLLLLPALFFVLGLAAMGWVMSRWDDGARMLGIAPEAPPAEPVPPVTLAPLPASPAPAPAPATAEPANAPEQIVIDPEMARRVGELERRFSQIDTQSRAAVGNADRAEGLLVAFAARRAIDRGLALGVLEPLLRERFGASQPDAVGAIISSARQPVTLQQLQEELRQLAPQLVGNAPQQSWWASLRGELGGLVAVRRKGTQSTDPRDRLRRAQQWLEAGNARTALTEVLRLPGYAYAGDWASRARRYVVAHDALDAIETAALVEPRAAPVPAAAPVRQPAQPQGRRRP